MTTALRFFVPGKPIGKGRPRFVRATGRAYTPAKTANYETLVKLAAMDAANKADMRPIEGAVRLTVEAKFERPASHYGTGRNAATLKATAPARPTGKPDADNILKAIGDAGNGVLWRDDSQIVSVRVHKWYCFPNEAEGVLIDVAGIGNDIAGNPAERWRPKGHATPCMGREEPLDHALIANAGSTGRRRADMDMACSGCRGASVHHTCDGIEREARSKEGKPQ